MIRCTAEERGLARASMYRLGALLVSYPTADTPATLAQAIEVALVGAPLLDPALPEAVGAVREAYAGAHHDALERAYLQSFTLTYSADCPLYETAYSARDLFQQTAQLADIAGFYRAFGVEPSAERPDHLAMELEFMYLLALKEAHARSSGHVEQAAVCRDAQRGFLREHLARWAPNIGERIRKRAGTSPYAAAGALIVALVRAEEHFLRLGTVKRFRRAATLLEEPPGDIDCEACPVAELVPLQLAAGSASGEKEAAHAGQTA